MFLSISTQGSRNLPRFRSAAVTWPRPTPKRASSGHSLNQSMVQQLTSEGNIRILVENYSFKGDIAIIKCILFFTLFKYWVNIFILFGYSYFLIHSALQADIISSISLSLYILVTSPELRTLLISSSIYSFIIWVSTNKNVRQENYLLNFLTVPTTAYIRTTKACSTCTYVVYINDRCSYMYQHNTQYIVQHQTKLVEDINFLMI